MIHENLSINNKGELCVAGVSTVDLAAKYGTPLYIMDENKIRENMRAYNEGIKEVIVCDDFLVIYASKACSFVRMAQIAKEEGIGLDSVSIGEVYTAKAAGFDLSRIFFHGNFKTDEDIEKAIEEGVGYFVADCMEEIETIQYFAEKKGVKQKILIRLTPGINPDTFEAVNTGKIDSKFGFSMIGDNAEKVLLKTLSMPNIDLEGFHYHLGSQMFDSEPLVDGAKIILDFMVKMNQKHGYQAKILDIGGGCAVRYTENDEKIDKKKWIMHAVSGVKKECERLGIKVPFIITEPGRSIVADAGTTVYKVGCVKVIEGYKTYVAIDGGMSDNPRYALYKSPYTVMSANNADKETSMKCSVVGRLCESGDIIQEDVYLPECKRGDMIAVLSTGAYNFSMSSNYNRVYRPAVVMVKDGSDYVAVNRQTTEDLLSGDVR